MRQMMTPDVNVLVAASRSDHPQHQIALTWLTGALAACANGERLRLMPMVSASFLRLVTNPKVFVEVTPVQRAVDFIDALLTVDGVEVVALGSEWAIFSRLCTDKKLTANQIPDAWLASAVIQLGEHLVTFDRDFKRLLGRGQVTVLSP